MFSNDYAANLNVSRYLYNFMLRIINILLLSCLLFTHLLYWSQFVFIDIRILSLVYSLRKESVNWSLVFRCSFCFQRTEISFEIIRNLFFCFSSCAVAIEDFFLKEYVLSHKLRIMFQRYRLSWCFATRIDYVYRVSWVLPAKRY